MSYVIAYPGGAYGNFVGFTLRWMVGDYPLDYRPFTPRGNSHGWIRKKLNDEMLETLEPLLGLDIFHIWHPKIEEIDFDLFTV